MLSLTIRTQLHTFREHGSATYVPFPRQTGTTLSPLFAIMLALVGSSICGFATVKLDPLCEACNLDGDKHVDGGTKGVGLLPGNEVGSDGWYDKLNPAGKEVMKRCFFTVFKECLADGLGENTFCETVVSESAKLGWTEAEDHEHEKVVECALSHPLPR